MCSYDQHSTNTTSLLYLQETLLYSNISKTWRLGLKKIDTFQYLEQVLGEDAHSSNRLSN